MDIKMFVLILFLFTEYANAEYTTYTHKKEKITHKNTTKSKTFTLFLIYLHMGTGVRCSDTRSPSGVVVDATW